MPNKVLFDNTPDIALYATFESILAAINEKSSISQCEKSFFMREIEGIIRNKTAPNHHFITIANGAFKECYDSDINGWIIKFTSTANNTKSEKQIYASAHDSGLGEIFLPTYFIDFPFTIPSEIISQDYLEPHFLDGCILQPKVKVLSEQSFFYCGGLKQYEPHPLVINNEPLPYEFFAKLGITSISWLQDIIDVYGADFFYKFCDFYFKFKLCDLHSENIGYYDGKPVIFDWLSD